MKLAKCMLVSVKVSMMVAAMTLLATEAALAADSVVSWIPVFRTAEDKLVEEFTRVAKGAAASDTTAGTSVVDLRLTVSATKRLLKSQEGAISALIVQAPVTEDVGLGRLARQLTSLTAGVASLLPSDSTKVVSDTEFKNYVQTAVGQLLQVQAAVGDEGRIGLVFGIGIAAMYWDRRDTEHFTVQAEEDSSGNQQSVLVRDSRSVTFPVVMTGVAVRFRDRWKVRGATTFWAATGRAGLSGLDWIVPTTLFGSAQLGFSGVSGAAGGVSIGVGWQLTGDTHLLLGFNAARLGSLRLDLRDQLEAAGGKRLVLKTPETESSIRSQEVSSGLVLVLAAPVGLKSLFGGQ